MFQFSYKNDFLEKEMSQKVFSYLTHDKQGQRKSAQENDIFHFKHSIMNFFSKKHLVLRSIFSLGDAYKNVFFQD